MRSTIVPLTFACLLVLGASAASAGRGPYVPPTDTIGWWIDAGGVPAAFADTTLEGALELTGVRGLHYPDGRGGFQPAMYDTEATSVGYASYDITKGTVSMRMPNASFSRIRLTYADVYEFRAGPGGPPLGDGELQDAAITLVAHGWGPFERGSTADVTMRLTLTEQGDSAESVTRSLHPKLDRFLNPADTISVPWSARPGDRLEVRVMIDATEHNNQRDVRRAMNPEFEYDVLRLETRILFEGLLNGAAIRPVRTRPKKPRYIEEPTFRLYR